MVLTPDLGNPFSRASSRHTGRLQIQLKMQACILRAKHPDQEFCWHMWWMLRVFLVQHRKWASLYAADEKRSIPVGNPGSCIQAVEKTRKVMTQVNGQWVALDHGWSMNNIVPSVVLKIQIPDAVSKSWYQGEVRVILKDKTFGNTDAAMRHTVENAIVCKDLGDVTPIMCHVHDGASDYNMTLGGALLAHIADFVTTGADMVISMRFCPTQSYNDPAEHCMSLLNMGLQALALARSLMPAQWERHVRGCSSMSDMRKVALDHPQVREELAKAMALPMRQVADRFSMLEWTEEPVKVLSHNKTLCP